MFYLGEYSPFILFIFRQGSPLVSNNLRDVGGRQPRVLSHDH